MTKARTRTPRARCASGCGRFVRRGLEHCDRCTPAPAQDEPGIEWRVVLRAGRAARLAADRLSLAKAREITAWHRNRGEIAWAEPAR